MLILFASLLGLGQVPDGRTGQTPGDLQRHAIESPLRRQIKGVSVVAPCHIVRMLGRDDRAEMFCFRRDDPQSAGARDIEVAASVDFDAVDGVFSRRLRHVEENSAIAQ